MKHLMTIFKSIPVHTVYQRSFKAVLFISRWIECIGHVNSTLRDLYWLWLWRGFSLSQSKSIKSRNVVFTCLVHSIRRLINAHYFKHWFKRSLVTLYNFFRFFRSFVRRVDFLFCRVFNRFSSLQNQICIWNLNRNSRFLYLIQISNALKLN